MSPPTTPSETEKPSRAVQSGLTPLTFNFHRLSPLTVFTSRAYFLHNRRRRQRICEVYSASFGGIFEGQQSKCVWQQAINCCSCYRMPQNAFFPPRTFSQTLNDVKTLFFFNLHHLSPVIFANTTVVAFLLLRRSRFSFSRSVNQRLLRNRPGSGSYDLSQLLARKITKCIHSCKTASLNSPVVPLNNHYHHHIRV